MSFEVWREIKYQCLKTFPINSHRNVPLMSVHIRYVSTYVDADAQTESNVLEPLTHSLKSNTAVDR